jgi:glycerol-3-phosphate dehydrogenase (NAD+)
MSSRLVSAESSDVQGLARRQNLASLWREPWGSSSGANLYRGRESSNLITTFSLCLLLLIAFLFVDITRPSSPVQASLPPSPLPSKRHKVAIVGSGSFGTALAKIVAKNVASRPKEFHSEVRMWVREKIVSHRGVSLNEFFFLRWAVWGILRADSGPFFHLFCHCLFLPSCFSLPAAQVHGKQLTKVINSTHMNDRYLPDVKLPSNLVAVGNLKQVVKDATMLVMVTPHQL